MSKGGILYVAALAITAAVIYPPYFTPSKGGGYVDSGFDWLWNVHAQDSVYIFHRVPDVGMLASEILAIIAITACAYLATNHR